MFDVKIGVNSLTVTGDLQDALRVAKQQTEATQIYDFRTNKLIYEWSPQIGVKEFLSE
jgi:hypothetical protein